MKESDLFITVNEEQLKPSEIFSQLTELTRVIEKDTDSAKQYMGITPWAIIAAIGAVVALLLNSTKEIGSISFDQIKLVFAATSLFYQWVVLFLLEGDFSPVKPRRFYNFTERSRESVWVLLFRFLSIIISFAAVFYISFPEPQSSLVTYGYIFIIGFSFIFLLSALFNIRMTNNRRDKAAEIFAVIILILLLSSV